MFVIDCSVVSSWLLPDEHEDIKNGLSSFIIEKNPKIYVPCLFYLEVMNVLEMAHKRKRIDRQTKSDALEALKSLPIVLDSGATDINLTTDKIINGQ